MKETLLIIIILFNVGIGYASFGFFGAILSAIAWAVALEVLGIKLL